MWETILGAAISGGATIAGAHIQAPKKEQPVQTEAEPQRPQLLENLDAAEFFLEGSRDEELERFSKALQTERTVFIWGLGGIGKTELAIALARKLQPDREVCLIHFKNSMRETIMGLEFDGYRFNPEPGMTPEERAETEYEERIGLLYEYYKDALLIVDNFDRPGKTLNELRGEQAFRDFMKLDLSRIFTTRSAVEDHPDWEVGPISEDKLLELMRHYDQDTDFTDNQFRELIRAVDGHTLTVELMARTLHASRDWGRITPEQLLDALHNSQLNNASFPQVETDQNRQYQQGKIFEHLKALFDLSNIRDLGRVVLACATLLPDSGMDTHLFWACLTDQQRDELIRLVQQGWLQKSARSQSRNALLTIHPVIRDVCREDIHPTDELCHDFLTQLWAKYNPNDSLPVTWEQFAACFALASDTLDDETGNYAAYAGAIYNTLNVYDYALKYNQRSLDIREKSMPPDHPDLATSYNNVGYAYGKLGDHKKALAYLLKALDVRERSLSPDHPNLAAYYNNVGYTYGKLEDNQNSLEYLLKALDISEQSLPANHPDLATSYNNVGYIYGELGDYQKELDYQLKALDIRKKSLPANHPIIAYSYDNVGCAYGDLGDNQKSLEYLLKALDIRKKSLPATHPDLAQSYNNVGYTYGEMGNRQKNLEYLLKALDICKKSLPPNHPNLAASYNNVGYAYEKLGDHKKALEYLLKALDIQKKSLSPNQSYLAASYNNVGLAYGNLGDHQKALEYKQKALDIWEKSLSPDHPNLATSYNNVGSTYFQLGRYQDALTYLNQALSILDQTPQYYHDKRANICMGLSVVYASMGDEENAEFYRRRAQQEEP